MGQTRIEWCDYAWNPITGCTPVSPGCQNCYARRMAHRLRGRYGYPGTPYDSFQVSFHPDRLEDPLHWRKPRIIFVDSMSDLFHEEIPFHVIARIFGIMHSANWHTYLVLTKRVERMAEFIEFYRREWLGKPFADAWPREYQHVWLGVSVENQEMADKRIPILLQIMAARRLVSVEPMLGPVNLCPWLDYPRLRADGKGWASFDDRPDLHWVIVGGETGPGARPMHPEWVRDLRNQCVAAKVPFFFKAWGDWWPIYGTGRLRGDEDEEHESWAWVSLDGKVSRSGAPPDALMLRIGKRRAGALLDGQEWRQISPGMCS